MSETDTLTADEFEAVEAIPTPKRTGGAGVLRDTKLRRFYAAAKAKPGTVLVFDRGAKSPNYGGDQAKARFPGLKMSSRQVGTQEVEQEGGGTKTVKLFDIYGVFNEPTQAEQDAADAANAADAAAEGDSGEGEGLV